MLHLAKHDEAPNILPRPDPTRGREDKKAKITAPCGRTKKSIYSQYETRYHIPMCLGDESTIEERSNYYEAKNLEACAGDINIYYNSVPPAKEHDFDDDDDFYADAFYAGYGSSGPSSDEDYAIDAESYPGYGPPNLAMTDNE